MTAARPPRLPGALFAGFTGVLFVLVAVVALTARAASPPSIAELAPQAVDELNDSSSASSDGLESEAGSGVVDGPDATTQEQDRGPGSTPDDEAPDEKAVRKCVGDPPRQTEDPQSPPCVSYWKGDNGGATWHKGVTGSEIKVAVGVMTNPDTGQPVLDSRAIQMYERYFNRRYEFYGRELRLIPYNAARAAAPAPMMEADALRVDEEIGAFAAVMYSEQDGNQTVYFDALARRQIMGVLQGILGVSNATEEHMREHAPYQWDYSMSVDRMQRAYGEFICAQLANKPPRYSGTFRWSPAGPPSKRTFGVVLSTEYGLAPFGVEPLRDAMAKCNTGFETFTYNGDAQAANVLIADLQEKEITDVLFTGQSAVLSIRLMNTASAQGYFPEWLVSNMGYQDRDDAALYFPPAHRDHVIGLQLFNKTLRLQDAPFMWALREIDPAAASQFGDETHLRLYQALLVLASGIQAAGPQLTPHNFERGLMRARFANPGAGQAPYYQARVGFPGVHTMTQDLVPIWLSSTERSPVSGNPPAYCYVDLGRRYGIGQWEPRDPAFHQDARGPCR